MLAVLFIFNFVYNAIISMSTSAITFQMHDFFIVWGEYVRMFLLPLCRLTLHLALNFKSKQRETTSYIFWYTLVPVTYLK